MNAFDPQRLAMLPSNPGELLHCELSKVGYHLQQGYTSLPAAHQETRTRCKLWKKNRRKNLAVFIRVYTVRYRLYGSIRLIVHLLWFDPFLTVWLGGSGGHFGYEFIMT